jgi:hypothetical protein
MTIDPDVPPPWVTALFTFLHPVQIATIEAFEWVGEPISAFGIYQLLDRTWPLPTVRYHVRRLADQGVLEVRYSEPRRGSAERYYGLAG